MRKYILVIIIAVITMFSNIPCGGNNKMGKAVPKPIEGPIFRFREIRTFIIQDKRYVIYYSENDYVKYDIFTGITLETQPGVEECLTISESRNTGSSTEVGLNASYSLSASAKVFTAQVTLEKEVNASFGVEVSKELEFGTSTVLQGNSEDGYGTYYLYKTFIITNVFIEQRDADSNTVQRTKTFLNVSLPCLSSYKLSKNAPSDFLIDII